MVESLQTMTHSRPATRPTPVMMPAPWMASSYIPLAASGDSSRNGVPGSISVITRSRGNNLPRARWRSRACGDPPSAALARCASSSATSARMAAWLARNSFEAMSAVDLMTATNPSHREGFHYAMPASATAGYAVSGSDFLALEDHVADDEQHHRGGDHADDLRPGDQDARGERQRRAEHGALQLAEIDRPQRPRGRIEQRHHHLGEQGRGREPRQDLLKLRGAGRLQAKRRVTRIRRHDDVGDRAGQQKVINGQMPSVTRAAVAAERNRIENSSASASHTPAYTMVTSRKTKLRAISSAPGGIPIRRRPSPITNSQSVTRLIDSVTRPARNLPNSKASR